MKSTRIIGLMLLIFALLAVAYMNTSAGDKKDNVTYGITTLAGKGGFTDLEKNIMSGFEKAMRNDGYSLSENPDISLLFSICEHKDDIILSGFMMHSLPDAIIKWGGDQEVFYMGIGNDEKENKPLDHNVRKYASEEYLHQFGSVFDSFTIIKPAGEFDQLLDEVVTKVTNKVK